MENFERIWRANFRKIKDEMPTMEFYKFVAEVISSLGDNSIGVSFEVPKYMPAMPF